MPDYLKKDVTIEPKPTTTNSVSPSISLRFRTRIGTELSQKLFVAYSKKWNENYNRERNSFEPALQQLLAAWLLRLPLVPLGANPLPDASAPKKREVMSRLHGLER